MIASAALTPLLPVGAAMSNGKNVVIDARRVIASALEVPVEDVPEDASLDNFALWDSLGHMRIVGHLEEILGRSLEIEEVLAVVSVESLAALIAGVAPTDVS